MQEYSTQQKLIMHCAVRKIKDIFIVFGMYSSTFDMKLNNYYEVKMLTFSFNLRVFTSRVGVGFVALFIPVVGQCMSRYPK